MAALFRCIGDLHPKYYGFVYIALIPIFAVVYCNFGEYVKFSQSLIDSIYFSLVTITTLGYGDITPNDDLGKFLVSFEALLGLLIFGLFLNSLSHKRNDEILKEELSRSLNHKEELRLCLEKHACLILDSFKTGNPFSWDKHAKNSANIDSLDPFLKDTYFVIVNGGHNIGKLNIKMLLESCDQNYETMLALSPVAANISSERLMDWSSLLSNIRNFRSQYIVALENIDSNGYIPWPSTEDISLQLIEYIDTTLRLCDKQRYR